MTDSTLQQRLDALAEAAALARGRLDDDAVDAAEAVVERAGQRLGLDLEATVVALAGPTGAGKSTLFNALAGADLATPGHLRPTTSVTMAAIAGEVGEPLLDWLQVRRRHQLADGPPGLVLLDLPDFDSVQRAHREEVERVVGLADLTVWVVDPQKYADGVLHEQYLQPLAGHAATMVVALNQADRLEPAARAACLADLRRLLSLDGVPDVPVLAVSATTGEGVEELHAELARRVAARRSAVERLGADVTAAAAALGEHCTTGGGARRVDSADRASLVASMAQAAGVPTVVDAVERAHRRRGVLATGWPPLRWLQRLRPDPLRRLHLHDDGLAARSSLPEATRMQVAQLEAATRTLASHAAGSEAGPWPALARSAALARSSELPALLDQAITGTDLHPRRPRWWRLASALQLLLVAVAAVGASWLLALAVLAYLQLDAVVPVPQVEGVPVPTVMLLAGLLAGPVLAVLARVLVGIGARRRARRAERALLRSVGAVADAEVLGPLEAELDARDRLCAAVQRAVGEGDGGGGFVRLLRARGHGTPKPR